MAIPNSFIQELIARADVVEIVGRHVQLKKTGANYSGLCPFHGEKSPSFSVSPTKQFYHCFGCGKNGNAISFLMEHNGMSFIEAIKDLAQSMGMQVPEDDRSPQDRARDAQVKTQQASLTEVLLKASDAYREHLKDSERGKSYFRQRGLTGEIAKQYALGYSPEGWRSLASVFPDYDDPLLVESGLVIEKPADDNAPEGEKKKYDRFRDRVMFPIRNVKGETIGFGGRVLDKGEPKYLNSPETPVFSKGRELYGLFEARAALQKSGFVLVTEGYMDVVALAQLGFPNAVATLGTACTTEHVQKLFRFTDHVVFSFDGDGAGRRAARKALDGAIPYATDTRTAKFLFLPPEHDPDSFVREHGAEAFSRCIADAVPLSRFLIDAARDGCDLATAEGRARFAAQAKPLWLPLPDGALKRQIMREIASLVELDERDLTDLWMPKPTATAAGGARTGYAANAPSAPYVPGSRDGEDPSKTKSKYPSKFSKPANAGYTARPSVGGLAGRAAPMSRADRALQILLLDNAAWNSLGNAEHHLLCELSAPHGAVFSWLDAQIAEHGAQTWGALSEGLRGHAHEAVTRKLVAAVPDDIVSDAQELGAILLAMLVDAENIELRELSSQIADPEKFARYKVLMERRKTRSLPAEV
jgi:DNA primase